MNTTKYIFSAICIIIALAGCKKDEVSPVQPSSITDIETFALPGEIGIKWTKTEPVTFEYIKVSYFDKLEKKEMIRLASQYSDTIIIPNTRAKYGDYTFKLQPFSITDTPGEIKEVVGKSAPAPADTISATETKLELKEHNLTSNDIQPTREPKYLLDNNTSTFFHSRWQNPQHDVHYLQINLDEPINDGFKFYYSGRDDGRNYPTEIRIEASTDEQNWNVLTTISSGLPNPDGTLGEYTSSIIWFKKDIQYRHFRLWVTKTKDGKRWFVMSEFAMWQVSPVLLDPEATTDED